MNAGVDTIDPGPRNVRPVWRRLGGRARDMVYRFATVVDRVSDWGAHEPMPPAHLRIHYYRTWKRKAFTRASEGAAAELISRGLRPEHRLLDIGSGIGNLAVGLIGYLRAGYDGVEIHPEAVTWCQNVITRRHPEFRFHRADLFSRAYNPHGRTAASEYRFPFGDHEFDFVFLGSVFTHMLPDAVEHYVHEISRVLAPNAICVASCFLLNQDSRSGIDAGRSFMSFSVEHRSRHCRLHDAAIPEAAVALDEPFVRRIHANAGLEICDIRRGSWWSGLADDQDVLTAVKISREAFPTTIPASSG
jgi:SAM-dependent methyltransferase